jgi:hypothetical protein
MRGRMLLVIDDVWDPDQVAPFLVGGRRCARLVTTRMPSVLPADVLRVRVDQMSRLQARELLVQDLPPVAPPVVDGLLAATGRWPLLLRLVNRVLAEAGRSSGDLTPVAAEILHLLHQGGPAGIDDLLGSTDEIDLNVPEQRARAVRATIEASTRPLAHDGATRLAELAVFAEDENVPLDLVEALWSQTAGLDRTKSRALWLHLERLSLVSLRPDAGRSLSMHDVVRDFLRGELGAAYLSALNGMLAYAVASELSVADSLAPGNGSSVLAWWTMKRGPYMWNHLIAHLVDHLPPVTASRSDPTRCGPAATSLSGYA